MAQPYEPDADAIRFARQIVDGAGCKLAQAIHAEDQQAIAGARHDLVVRIAQAVMDAEHIAADQARGEGETSRESMDEPGPQSRTWPALMFGSLQWASAAVRPARGAR